MSNKHSASCTSLVIVNKFYVKVKVWIDRSSERTIERSIERLRDCSRMSTTQTLRSLPALHAFLMYERALRITSCLALNASARQAKAHVVFALNVVALNHVRVVTVLCESSVASQVSVVN